MTGGAICNGGESFEVRTIGECATEGKRRRIYRRFQHWYGWESYCLGCGDRWTPDEIGSRPFARGWRAEAIVRHKAKWDRTPVRTPAERKAAWRAFMDRYFAELEATA